MFEQLYVLFSAIGFLISNILLVFPSYHLNYRNDKFLGLLLLSLSSANLYFSLNAPDVGMTELAVGAFVGCFLSAKSMNVIIGKSSINLKSKYRFATIVMSIMITMIVSAPFLLSSDANVGTVANNSFVTNYYKNSYHETNIKNVVTTILAYFRGFDTMFETVVIYIAAMSVKSILSSEKQKPSLVNISQSEINLSYAKIFGALLPIFALAIHFCGDDAPGGGFQAGALLAGTFVCCDITNLTSQILRKNIEKISDIMGAVGCLIYALSGLVCFAMGGEFLDYKHLPFGKNSISIGILFVETGVLFAVTGSFIILYTAVKALSKCEENADLHE